ncbi:type IV pilin [Halobacteriales archaeon QS_6_64_34]|nr:MAG: type IV pilin [Halobacteriales archaeon QS_6_64_34]
MNGRAQSHVVGVVLLLGITTIALGGLTTVVGEIIDGQTATADERRVANALDSELRPVKETGPNRVDVRFSEGRLATVERELRVLTDSGVRREIAIGGLVYTSGTNRVGFVGGAITRGKPGNAWLVRGPPVTVTRDNDTLVVGAVTLGEQGAAVGGSGGVTARLRTNVTHERTALPRADYRIAVETATPEPLARHLRDRGLATTRRDIDGDGVPSVVAGVEGQQELQLVVHRTNTEVAGG